MKDLTITESQLLSLLSNALFSNVIISLENADWAAIEKEALQQAVLPTILLFKICG